MTDDLSQNPRLRVQQSTPSGLPSANTPPPMSEGSYYPQAWNTYQPYLSPHTTQQQDNSNASYRSHKRVSSGSSVGSAGPNSPYTQSSVYPHIVDTDTQSAQSPHLDSFDGAYAPGAQYSKPLFASTTNALHNGSLFNSDYNFEHPVNHAGSHLAAPIALRPAMTEQRQNNMNAGLTSSPRRSFGGDYNPEMGHNPPKFDRTLTDMYNDELYSPGMAASAAPPPPPPQPQPRQSQQSQANLLSPAYRSVFSDRLQAANSARSASPVTAVARERSPFRESSEYAGEGYSQSNPNSPGPRLNSAAQIRQQQKIESDAHAYAQHHPPARHDFGAPNTISPKEALLDYAESEDDAKMSLFPQQVKPDSNFSSVNGTARQYPRSGTTAGDHREQTYAPPRTSTNYSSTPQATPNFALFPPPVPVVPQQYPFIARQRRQSSSMRSTSDQVPDFPSTLTSMESTKSDSGSSENVRPPAFSSQESSFQEPASPLRRPSDTSANSGTYTCTTPSCTARFETSAKLQKHRREAHRVSPFSPSTPTTPSSTATHHNTQAAQNNVSRNNLPGPHKCEKLNPSTGKPCNTIFSRSYDLTRHEDTIHSNRKQKVRCHLCTEEKTFSRNDALTRHMRVVHPDVDFPGKTRRGRVGGA